ncbi:uncharacterized protein LOC117178755 [Belonocnema kinseyi]|uniref:uncharacterized protein LOC117178755 n=1 Tax=Belonocnema kinseyi TaxID=2817044 RepID=UPI00143CEB16|nr:uncharacterized protein LOC117178755 [Belonocnema kinseyi]
MKKEIVDIKRSLQEQSQTSSGDLSLSEKLLAPLEGFLLQTVEQFQNLDEKENLKLWRTVYRHLINRGGAKLREFLSFSLKLMVTDELVTHFTWLGAKSHKAFGDTRVSYIFYKAAKKFPCFPGPRDIKEFTTEMEVFRTTKQRSRNISKNTHGQSSESAGTGGRRESKI